MPFCTIYIVPVEKMKIAKHPHTFGSDQDLQYSCVTLCVTLHEYFAKINSKRQNLIKSWCQDCQMSLICSFRSFFTSNFMLLLRQELDAIMHFAHPTNFFEKIPQNLMSFFLGQFAMLQKSPNFPIFKEIFSPAFSYGRNLKSKSLVKIMQKFQFARLSH